MGRLVGILVVLLVTLGVATPAGASRPPKTALLYGDSLVWESNWSLSQAMAAKSGWTVIDRSIPATAPCDWLDQLSSDLATYHPATVTIATAGNSATPCMIDPDTGDPYEMGSPGMLAKYRADLETFVQRATGAGARFTFVYNPPFLDTRRETSQVQLAAFVTNLGSEYPGVSVAKSIRAQLSKHGKYTPTKPCLKTETAAMGCDAGQIRIRDQVGLHLCPDGLAWMHYCDMYSSGELRYGKVLASVATHPPKPVV